MSQHSDGRMPPLDAGRAFINMEFPEADVAIIAGSNLRGEDTPTSDLDVMIVTNREDAPFRAFGWPIGAFVHSDESFRWYFRGDYERPMPTLVSCSV